MGVLPKWLIELSEEVNDFAVDSISFEHFNHKTVLQDFCRVMCFQNMVLPHIISSLFHICMAIYCIAYFIPADRGQASSKVRKTKRSGDVTTAAMK